MYFLSIGINCFDENDDDDDDDDVNEENDDGEGETCFPKKVKTFFQFLRWTVTCLNSDVLQVSHRVFQKNGLIGTKILQLF